MDDTASAYEQLTEKLIQWAQTEENVRAAIVIGSRARLDHPADEWSDLDVLIFAYDPEPYLTTSNWLHHIGSPWLTFVEPTPDGSGFERRVLFQGGLLVNDVWYHTVWTGKHLRRGEIWWAKSCCDGYLKHLLRQMMEWHTRASRGEGVDTWMRGRFLEEWADVRAVESLPVIFAHYDEQDIWRALMATMELFRWLAVEAAEMLGYSYPSFGEKCAAAFLQGLFSGRTQP